MCLPDKRRARDEAVPASGQRVGEQSPRQQTGVDKDGIGEPAGVDPGEPAEHHAEHDHFDKRLDQGPKHSEYGLLVSNLDVAPGKKIEQLPVGPEFAEM